MLTCQPSASLGHFIKLPKEMHPCFSSPLSFCLLHHLLPSNIYSTWMERRIPSSPLTFAHALTSSQHVSPFFSASALRTEATGRWNEVMSDFGLCSSNMLESELQRGPAPPPPLVKSSPGRCGSQRFDSTLFWCLPFTFSFKRHPVSFLLPLKTNGDGSGCAS